MDRETVIQLARAAGAHEKHQVMCMDFDDLERFANAIEQRTLEGAAVELENETTQSGENVAAAIRALKDTP
jgi:hypothetical protein